VAVDRNGHDLEFVVVKHDDWKMTRERAMESSNESMVGIHVRNEHIKDWSQAVLSSGTRLQELSSIQRQNMNSLMNLRIGDSIPPAYEQHSRLVRNEIYLLITCLHNLLKAMGVYEEDHENRGIPFDSAVLKLIRNIKEHWEDYLDLLEPITHANKKTKRSMHEFLTLFPDSPAIPNSYSIDRDGNMIIGSSFELNKILIFAKNTLESLNVTNVE
jgi:hypothetical protein